MRRMDETDTYRTHVMLTHHAVLAQLRFTAMLMRDLLGADLLSRSLSSTPNSLKYLQPRKPLVPSENFNQPKALFLFRLKGSDAWALLIHDGSDFAGASFWDYKKLELGFRLSH